MQPYIHLLPGLPKVIFKFHFYILIIS